MLFEFAQWSEATGLGKMIRNSQYAFPIVEFFHLAALAIIGGAILIVDMRLLGLGSEEDVRRAARERRAAVGDGQPDRDAAVTASRSTRRKRRSATRARRSGSR